MAGSSLGTPGRRPDATRPHTVTALALMRTRPTDFRGRTPAPSAFSPLLGKSRLNSYRFTAISPGFEPARSVDLAKPLNHRGVFECSKHEFRCSLTLRTLAVPKMSAQRLVDGDLVWQP